MVRLLLDAIPRERADALAVSIPQWCDCCVSSFYERPNSCCVSIPQWCDCCWALMCTTHRTLSCFNPTMVRLLLAQLPNDSERAASFNPTMVRLLRNLCSVFRNDYRVSIPQWCDCCCWSRCRKLKCVISFNPTMVRLLPRQNLGV